MEDDAPNDRIEEQLVVLRDQLLQLSPTEQQLNNAPMSEQLPSTVEVRPQAALCAATSTTIQTTLQVCTDLPEFAFSFDNRSHFFQQWETIFQQTFAEYERLLSRLQEKCDESATTEVWRNHLDQAENYLSRSLPDQYRSTCEDRDLCEVQSESP